METAKSLHLRWPLRAMSVALLAIVIWWITDQPAPPPDPPVAPAPSAFNAHQIKILGSAKCGECHVEQFEDYQSSGHAKTLWSTRDFPFRERFEGLKFFDTDRQTTLNYFLAPSGMDVVVPDKFDGDRFPLQFAFGSGDHAITFVTLTPDGSGVPVGIEHRVSWFSGLDQAGLTPGQLGMPVGHDIESFGRVLRGTTLERCFECHTTSGRIVGDQVVDLIPNVGCENCHPGGARHAAVMQAGSSTHPKDGFEQRPWRTADQIRICAECHRGEHSVEPQKITPENTKLVRFQPVGLVQSECYVQSDGQMTCSTCHNPHQHAARQSPLQYEQKCLQCHSTSPHAVRCPVSPDTNCVTCHMPRIEVHPSISFHDHWIRVRDDTDPVAVQETSDAER